MSSTDRGTERRRLLDAVRNVGDTDHGSPDDIDDQEVADPETAHEGLEPAPDGGTVRVDESKYRCSSCGHRFSERPRNCSRCGGSSFDRRGSD